MSSSFPAIRWLPICLLAALVVGCNAPAGTNRAVNPETGGFAGSYPIQAVATTGMVGDIVRNMGGDMVPLSTLLTVRDTAGAKTVFRFNNYPSATITGQPAAGYSSGQAVAAVEAMKATHDIKSPHAGTVVSIQASIGDEIDNTKNVR